MTITDLWGAIAEATEPEEVADLVDLVMDGIGEVNDAMTRLLEQACNHTRAIAMKRLDEMEAE